ncbi:Helicase SKI2W, variant 2 [Clonorchis sinensis]|uniref:Helicase SKI2W, variant 2 n=2 Tax=Clonorchis sinensis TaxID=79923 RepID=A0A8T1M2Z8_CLOSI|nr:Helicase SKI2W, variant 2 [Clonorchis sinensis]
MTFPFRLRRRICFECIHLSPNMTASFTGALKLVKHVYLRIAVSSPMTSTSAQVHPNRGSRCVVFFIQFLSQDPAVIHDVSMHLNELRRRVKDRFSLMHMNVCSSGSSDDIENHKNSYEKLLSLPNSVLQELGLHSIDKSTFSLANLETETRLLMEKRLKHQEPMRKYAVLEDTSQQLPSFSKLVKDPAYTWPFELDTFQKQAILCLERNQSVFVAAHTSAGKTVVAEYACAMCRRRGSRVIYTSPIKALSNQKFHDFRRTFGEDVGLLTGDIKVATESTFLVMTTEILYNMLCNAADAIRDLEVVIMDEVHYLNDAERGHVWEQIMIMLPKHVLLVMLSATVPNTMEFADWLGRIRGSEIHVVATNRRPVPLEHYLFTGLDGQTPEKQLHLVVDKHSQFNLPGYKQAVVAFNAPKLKKANNEKSGGDTSRADELAARRDGAVVPGGGGRGGKGGAGGSKQHYTGGKASTPGRWNYTPSPGGLGVHEKRIKNMWLGVVRLLQERELMPAIAFGFSRNSLETLAENLSSVDLLSKDEKNEVQQFLRYSIKNRLKGPDKRLPSVLFITDLACRGLAVHHAGMLPLLKETVEMLFQRGLIRLLFATETFAMGVNMPARCVLFSTLEKYDGRRRRPLNPGEYTQMAGRAGRRGLDASGTVIIMVEGVGASVASPKLGVPAEATLTSMILGTPTQLVSQFKITYSMILHLHRTNWLSPQDIMRRSFMEAPALRREIERRQWLSRLRARLTSTTTLIPCAGSSHATTSSWMSKAAPVASASVPTGEPVLQVKCPLGQIQCAESMATYYQACCKFRQLNSTASVLLARQAMSDLQRVFCPGRLVFVQVPATSQKGNLRNRETLPNWLVPALVVDINKALVQGQTETQWNLITWQLPDRVADASAPRPYQLVSDTFSTKGVGNSAFDIEEVKELEEEEVLCDGEDCWMSPTPFPPQLMPVFIPFSFDDSLGRLTLLTNQSLRNLVRVCDQVLHSKTSRPCTNSSGTLSDQLTRAIRRHRQEMAAAEAGLRLLVGANTSAADSALSQLILEVNQELLDLVQPLASPDTTPSVVFGLLPDCPPALHLGRAIKIKLSPDETTSVFDELWMLGEELTTPLLGTSVTQRLAPVTCPDLVSHFALFHRTCRRRWAVRRLEASLSDDKLHLNTEYIGRLRVLEELGFIDSATERGCLSLKGLVACELQQMEVLLTQLLLDGSFTQLPPADIAALLSCFVFEIRASDTAREEHTAQQSASSKPQSHLVVLDTASSDTAPTPSAGPEPAVFESAVVARKIASVPEHLKEAVAKMFSFASNLEQLQRKHGLSDPTTDTRLNCTLVQVTHAWATGHPFSTLVTLTEMQEGNLVRGLLRLDELLRHICNACHRLGDQALCLRMNEARNAIHRDLVCAPSLYISEEFVYSTTDKSEST